MFTPIHLMPQFNLREQETLQKRWQTEEGLLLKKQVLSRLNDVQDTKPINPEIFKESYRVTERPGDLRGLSFSNETIDFKSQEAFRGFLKADFSYSKFTLCTFSNGVFTDTIFKCTGFFDVKFVNCRFVGINFDVCTFDNVAFTGCIFLKGSTCINCDFSYASFQNTFLYKNIFHDCRFNEKTGINDPLDRLPSGEYVKFNMSDTPSIYKAVKEAYKAGEVRSKILEYKFKEMRATTHHCLKGKDRVLGYVSEYITGYGVRPLRVLGAAFCAFLIPSFIFVLKIGLIPGLLLSGGGFYTFGANTDALKTMPAFYTFVYLVEAFTGVSSMALFITVLANYWFGEQ